LPFSKNSQSNKSKYLTATYLEKETALPKVFRAEVTSYFAGELKSFSVPILEIGIDFQKQIRGVLLVIHYGKRISYLELSERYQDSKAILAVA
jgi:O6-methylguanine-DNA--protein-cysteine methyltransferase